MHRKPILTASLLAVALLAGCVDDAPQAAPDGEAPGPAPKAQAHRLQYGCLGDTTWSSEPCPDPAASFPYDAAMAPDGALWAWVARDDADFALGAVTATGPSTATVYTSTDQGRSVTSHHLPAPALEPGGQWALRTMDLAVSDAGTLHVLARTERDTLLVDLTENTNGANDGGVAYYRSADGGATWTWSEFDDDGAFFEGLAAAEGHVLAHWWDEGALRVAVSRDDGLTWTEGSIGRDCRGGAPAAWLGGRFYVACVNDLKVFQRTGRVHVYAVGFEGGEVHIELVANDVATCGSARLFTDADGLLLVMGSCPLVEVHASKDGTDWALRATVDGAAVGRPGLDDAGVDLLAAELDGGLLHAVVLPMFDLNVPSCTCSDGEVVHALLASHDGSVLDHRIRQRATDNPADLLFDVASRQGVGLLVSSDLLTPVQRVRADPAAP